MTDPNTPDKQSMLERLRQATNDPKGALKNVVSASRDYLKEADRKEMRDYVQKAQKAESSGNIKKAVKLYGKAFELAAKIDDPDKPYIEAKLAQLKRDWEDGIAARLMGRHAEKEAAKEAKETEEAEAAAKKGEKSGLFSGLRKKPKPEEQESIEQIDITKGFDCFTHSIDVAIEEENERYENFMHASAITSLLYDDRSYKKKRLPELENADEESLVNKSLLEILNLDPKHLLTMFQALFSNIAGRRISRKEIIKWFDTTELDIQELIYEKILRFNKNTDAGQIDEALIRFDEYFRELKDWPVFSPVLGEENDENNVALRIMGVALAFREIKEKCDTPEDMQREKKRVLGMVPLPSDNQVRRPDEDYINRLLRRFGGVDEQDEQEDQGAPEPQQNQPNQPAAAPAPQANADVQGLRNREGLKEALYSLELLGQAFREQNEAQYDANHRDLFGGNRRIDVKRTIDFKCGEIAARNPNTKVPQFFGGFLLTLKNPDAKDDLLEAIRERYGIEDDEEMSELIEQLYEMIGEIYPDFLEANPYFVRAREEAEEDDLYDFFNQAGN